MLLAELFRMQHRRALMPVEELWGQRQCGILLGRSKAKPHQSLSTGNHNSYCATFYQLITARCFLWARNLFIASRLCFKYSVRVTGARTLTAGTGKFFFL